MSEILDKVRTFLTSRKQAYLFTFDQENVYAKIVLADLAKFCRANETTYLQDPRAHAALEGRREVWLRIQQYTNLSPDELWDLYRKE